MKKIILSAIMLVAIGFAAQAQRISKNALGFRISDNDGFGGEISYQRAVSSGNRLEFDLGWRNSNHYDAFKVTGLYQWVWNIEGDFNWYAGVGGGLGSWDHNHHDNHQYDDSGTFVYAAGDIGIEYGFKEVPILISLDARPEIRTGYHDDDNFGFDVGLGIRYQF
ncbi:hypothetical protein [Flavobacterium agrisoli]|uniref:Outer membrane protein n=1 Tax=Flavobacterium agrisoli TaxID=2793066 RepID=A0A934PL33_9FLAO|nr:hypothetical protein [Flavobacterium agrisoli]MBK0368481.1 hypothetical protein [Flavobacterium agrisoli]